MWWFNANGWPGVTAISLQFHQLSNLFEMPDTVNNHDIRKLLLSYPRRAIRILCDNYYKSLLKIAYNLTHDRDAAKDIVQDTFAYGGKIRRNLETIMNGLSSTT